MRDVSAALDGKETIDVQVVLTIAVAYEDRVLLCDAVVEADVEVACASRTTTTTGRSAAAVSRAPTPVRSAGPVRRMPDVPGQKPLSTLENDEVNALTEKK